MEVQYYLLVGLMFPLLASRSARTRLTTMAVLAAFPLLLPSTAFVCRWLVLFLMGIGTFQFRNGLVSRRTYLVTLPA